jgi:hypothetical protein
MTKDFETVFVVHGRNEKLRSAMFDFLRAIGLKPLEWDQAVSLTGNGSPYIGEVLDAAFATAQAVVVLFTPDEITYLRPDLVGADDPESQPKTQARPNVLFEAGMAFGHDAKHTVIVEIGSIRPFSDIGGRHAVRLANDAETRKTLAQRLQTAGCNVDLTGADWLKAGDFTPPVEPGNGLPLGRRVPSASQVQPRVAFDLRYFNLGGNKIDKLQVINRGSETIYNVNLKIPDRAGLILKGFSKLPIEKIPGGGKSVTVYAMNESRMFMGGSELKTSFDVSISGTLESGETVKQSVFIDLNR